MTDRYPNASDEPLEIIRANECAGTLSLRVKRAQRLWNEIVRLRRDLAQADKMSRARVGLIESLVGELVVVRVMTPELRDEVTRLKRGSMAYRRNND